jgi:HSP20 family molecular chaperone IbpA
MDMRKEGFAVGQRVEVSPAYDIWMRGDRFGVIIGVTAKSVSVRMDKSNKVLRVTRPTGIYQVIV